MCEQRESELSKLRENLDDKELDFNERLSKENMQKNELVAKHENEISWKDKYHLKD